MFATAFVFLFASMFTATAAFSEVLTGVLYMAALILTIVFFILALVALPARWRPRTTCFIYPTFACGK